MSLEAVLHEGQLRLGVAKISSILRHLGVQLILAYSWARPDILVAGKDRGGGGRREGYFYFFCFFAFIPAPFSSLPVSFISSTISFISLLLFSGRRHKMTHNQIREENETSQVFVTKAQVRAVDKMAILIFFFFFFFFFFFRFFMRKHCGYSLQVPWHGTSNEYAQHQFSWRK